LATQPIGVIALDTPKPSRVEIDDWIIEILGDIAIVKCVGAVTVSTRTGQLGHVTLRRDPPAASSSRGTEIIGK
jgi:hypothetical protein